MSNQTSGDETDSATDRDVDPELPNAVTATETYQTDEGTVFYDAENPLAWLQTDAPLRLSEMA